MSHTGSSSAFWQCLCRKTSLFLSLHRTTQTLAKKEMKQWLLAALLLLGIFLLCTTARAGESSLPAPLQPSRALVSFSGAACTADLTVPVENDGGTLSLRLLLPATAQDILVTSSKAVLADRHERKIFGPGAAGTDAATELRKEKGRLTAEKIHLTARLEKADWGKEASAESLMARLGEIEAGLAVCEQALKNLPAPQNAWTLVTIRLAADSGLREIPLRCSWHEPGLHWQPVYSLNCVPGDKGQGRIEVRLDADITRPAGPAWKDTELVLVSGAADSAQIPPLAEWHIGASARPMLRAMPRPLTASAVAETEDMAAGNAPAAAETGGSFAVWKPVLRGLREGRGRLLLAHAVWTEKLLWTVRPLNQDARVFLCAEHVLNAEEETWPEGPMLLSVDDSYAGDGHFAPREGKVFLSFGNDPRVRLEARTEPRKSGREGILTGKKKVWEWAWTYTLRNGRDREIAVRVERPVPLSVDKDIEVNFTGEPSPVRDDRKLVWDLRVPARGTGTVRHAVKVTAPADSRYSPAAP